MFKKFLIILGLMFASASFAAVDVNKASAAELDSIKGIGPGMSEKILNERKNRDFKDWNDFIDRISGVGEKTAARFSAEGLMVNGKRFSAAAQAKAEKKKKEANTKAHKPGNQSADKTADKGHKGQNDPAAAPAPQATASAGQK